jgi:enoyl-CoA hydratase/carnithine racemase
MHAAVSDPPVQLVNETPVARLVLSCPPKNEMDGAFFAAFRRMCAGPLCGLHGGALVVHGAGRHFSSGANIGDLVQRMAGGSASDDMEQNLRAFSDIAALPMPTVAAVSGCCLGAGLELALACRHRIAASNAVFSAPEISYGLIPGCGGTVRLPRLVGVPVAVEMILTGRLVDAEEALRTGLVDRVVDRRELLGAACEMALDLSKRRPTA